MDFILPLAAKSLLIAGAVLIALRLAHRRSAAERSWIAHIGLAAIAALPLALLLPRIEVPAPAFLAEPAPSVTAPAALGVPGEEVAGTAGGFPALADPGPWAGVDWAVWLYAAPAALLLLLTLTALLRLVLLKANATVLVEPRWLSALAHAQRRMGFKHGTALLTSDDLRSPISWGLMRPVILLNSEAAGAHAQAEAVIAHELAHVAHLDWLKLLLARVTVALFWFNPLVWLLAREAHQLREEAADDAVLASDVEDTDYAKLLVGIARHECRGLLIGAHGVAPARGSLARRVARVLDGNSVRGPVARSFALGVFAGAAALAAPLAAVTLTSGDAAEQKPVAAASAAKPYYPGSSDPLPATVGASAGQAAGQAIGSAVAAAGLAVGSVTRDAGESGHPVLQQDGFTATSSSGATISNRGGHVTLRQPHGGTIVISPPDSSGRQKVVMEGPDGATMTYPDARRVPGLEGLLAPPRSRSPSRNHSSSRNRSIDQAIGMKAVGATPEYIAALRAASPTLRNADAGAFIGMKAVGVTPEYVRELASTGVAHAPGDLAGARAVGVTGAYIRAMAARGYRGTLQDYIGMRAVGVTPDYADEFRKRGISIGDTDQLIEMKAHKLEPKDVGDGP